MAELEATLGRGSERAKVMRALVDFEQIICIGIRLTEDLFFIGYHSIEELRKKDGDHLLDAYEKKKGFWTDSCVEDQFRLAVYVADTGGFSKNWWDFTTERKEYRLNNGYPNARPIEAWHETVSSESEGRSFHLYCRSK